MDFNLTNLLKLPNITVLSCQQQEGFIGLNLEFLNEGIICPHCQTYTDDLHQTRPILVRDLSILGQPVYLKVPRRLSWSVKLAPFGFATCSTWGDPKTAVDSPCDGAFPDRNSFVLNVVSIQQKG